MSKSETSYSRHMGDKPYGESSRSNRYSEHRSDRNNYGDNRSHRSDDRKYRNDDRTYRDDDRSYRRDDRSYRRDDRSDRRDDRSDRRDDRSDRRDDRSDRRDDRSHRSGDRNYREGFNRGGRDSNRGSYGKNYRNFSRQSKWEDEEKDTNRDINVPKGRRLSVHDRPTITPSDLEGKSEEEKDILLTMGFGSFDTTKGRYLQLNPDERISDNESE